MLFYYFTEHSLELITGLIGEVGEVFPVGPLFCSVEPEDQ